MRAFITSALSLSLVAAGLSACATRPKPFQLSPETQKTVDSADALLSQAADTLTKCNQPGYKAVAEADIGLVRVEIGTIRSGLDTSDAQLQSLDANLQRLVGDVAQCEQADAAVQQHNATCVGDVHTGMTQAQVQTTMWCAPNHVKRTERAGHVEEQWIYKPRYQKLSGISQPNGYLFFKDGVLVEIQRIE
jgi:hypothetical protein